MTKSVVELYEEDYEKFISSMMDKYSIYDIIENSRAITFRQSVFQAVQNLNSGAGAVIPFKEPTQKLPDDKELVAKLSSWFPPILEKLQSSDFNIYPRLMYDSNEDEPIEIYVKK